MATRRAPGKGLRIESVFTQGRPAAQRIAWKKFDALIRERNGRVHFDMKGVEAPADWSQLAVEIAASRYFRCEVARGDAFEVEYPASTAAS